MKHSHATFFLLIGLWFSLVAFVLGGALLIPHRESGGGGMTALLLALRNEKPEPSPRADIPAYGKTIVADLAGMRIFLYEDGIKKTSYPILSRGRDGTFWETPTGRYAIKTKELAHFSSIGGVWMPYSMQFYGNYFIHGWPSYPDGRSVALGYSGGCLRLSTDDAEEVYRFASVGTAVIIEGGAGEESFATSSRYYFDDTGDPPIVSATGVLVADAVDRTLLWSRGEDGVVRPGGLTSLLTALTALETVNQYKYVRVSELLLGRPVIRNKKNSLDDDLSLGALIYPLVFGGNDTAAKAFAREHGTTQFVAAMNEKAAAIGMANSSWGGPLSTDPATTSPRDLFRLLSYVNERKHFLIDASLSDERSLDDEYGARRYTWTNKNPWVISGDLRYRGGVAEIQNDGSGSAVLLFDLPLAEFEKRTIAVVVTGSAHTIDDVARITDFVTRYYAYGVERSDMPPGEGEMHSSASNHPGVIEAVKNMLIPRGRS